MRFIQRDMRGNVVGGRTAEGERIGTLNNRSWNKPPGGVGGSPTPRLDAGVQTPRLDAGVQTPRLDAMAGAQVPGGGPPESIAGRAKRRRSEVNREGGFGKGAQARQQNLDGRIALFEDMKTAGAEISPEMEARRKSLGIDGAGMNRAMAKIPEAPAMPAGPDGSLAPSPGASQPGGPTANNRAYRKPYTPLASGGTRVGRERMA